MAALLRPLMKSVCGGKKNTTKQPKRGKATAGAKALPKFINSHYLLCRTINNHPLLPLTFPPRPTAQPPVFTRCQRDGRGGFDARTSFVRDDEGPRARTSPGPAAAPAPPRPGDTRGRGPPPWAWTGASPAHRGPPRE